MNLITSTERVPYHRAVLWLEDALVGDEAVARPALSRTITTDVCIVGGGYTGLWTAIEIKERAPDTRVTILEATICGAGASGRNGGWATGWHDELPELIERFGLEQALWLAAQSSLSIDRIRQTAEDHGFDVQFRQRGALWTATAPAQLGAWERAVQACRTSWMSGHARGPGWGGGPPASRFTYPLGAARQTDAASVHPARLVRGLRRAALRLGVTMYESTPVLGFTHGKPSIVQTPMAEVEADQSRPGLGAGEFHGARLMYDARPVRAVGRRRVTGLEVVAGDSHRRTLRADTVAVVGDLWPSEGSRSRCAGRGPRPAITGAARVPLRRWLSRDRDDAGRPGRRRAGGNHPGAPAAPEPDPCSSHVSESPSNGGMK